MKWVPKWKCGGHRVVQPTSFKEELQGEKKVIRKLSAISLFKVGFWYREPPGQLLVQRTSQSLRQPGRDVWK